MVLRDPENADPDILTLLVDDGDDFKRDYNGVRRLRGDKRPMW